MAADRVEQVAPSAEPLVPALYRVADRRPETEDVTTLWLAPASGPPLPFRAGQFNMLTASVSARSPSP